MRVRVCVSSADACMRFNVRDHKCVQMRTAGQAQALFNELPAGEDVWPVSSHLIQSALAIAPGRGPYVPASHKRHLEPFSSSVEYLPKYVNRHMNDVNRHMNDVNRHMRYANRHMKYVNRHMKYVNRHMCVCVSIRVAELFNARICTFISVEYC